MQRPGCHLPNISAGAFCALLLCLTLPTNLPAQNGVTANESSTTITGASSVDAMWADASDHRWKVNNNNNNGANGADIAVWPCTGSTQAGGIVYAGSVPTGGSVNLENCLSLPSPAALGVPLLVGSSAPQWGAENVDIGNYALAVEVNTNATAPTQYKLVIFTGAPTTVTIASTSSTTGVEGICVGNCSGSIAQIAREGVAGCVFDTTTTAGHYVQASTTDAGQCKDVGATYPTNGNQVIGRVLASNGSTGQTVNVMLYPPGIWTQLPLSGTGSKYQTTSITSSTSGDVVTYDASQNTQDSGTLLSSLAPLASPTFTGTPAAPTASVGTSTTQLATTAFVSNRVWVGPATSYTNNTTSLTPVLTSPTIPVNATIAFHCSGTYSFQTNPEKAEFGITAGQTPQSINYFGYIVTSTAGGNLNYPAPGITNGAILASTTAAANTTGTFAFVIEGTMVWNASNPGTFTLGAATNSTSGTIAIAVNNASCTLY